MKILLLDRDFHNKNRDAIYAYKNIQITPFYNANDLTAYNLSDYDAVYSPGYPIDVSKYPNTRFIFGPHFSVFPEQNLQFIKGPKTVYIQPSEWAMDVWKTFPVCNDIDMQVVPFGVDTEKYSEVKPITERTKVFLYYKTRISHDMEFVVNFLNTNNIKFKIFSYDHKYSESEFLHYLQESKYGIWVGRHESQGFALEEALSCNVPLLVWDVVSMNQEIGQNYADIPATVIPYWDNNCGEFFYDKNEFLNKFTLFQSKLHTYNPRQYVLNNLSRDVCDEIFRSVVNKIES